MGESQREVCCENTTEVALGALLDLRSDAASACGDCGHSVTVYSATLSSPSSEELGIFPFLLEAPSLFLKPHVTRPRTMLANPVTQ